MVVLCVVVNSESFVHDLPLTYLLVQNRVELIDSHQILHHLLCQAIGQYSILRVLVLAPEPNVAG